MWYIIWLVNDFSMIYKVNIFHQKSFSFYHFVTVILSAYTHFDLIVYSSLCVYFNVLFILKWNPLCYLCTCTCVQWFHRVCERFPNFFINTRFTVQCFPCCLSLSFLQCLATFFAFRLIKQFSFLWHNFLLRVFVFASFGGSLFSDSFFRRAFLCCALFSRTFSCRRERFSPYRTERLPVTLIVTIRWTARAARAARSTAADSLCLTLLIIYTFFTATPKELSQPFFKTLIKTI